MIFIMRKKQGGIVETLVTVKGKLKKKKNKRQNRQKAVNQKIRTAENKQNPG